MLQQLPAVKLLLTSQRWTQSSDLSIFCDVSKYVLRMFKNNQPFNLYSAKGPEV